MKTTVLSALALLVSTAFAAPAAPQVRQVSVVPGDTANELEDGSCKPIIFIFARGTFETGNMGTFVGPQTCSALKDRFGAKNLACQGVGGAYLADALSNTLPGGTNQAALDEGTRLFDLAASKCPNSVVIAAGYSQGAALIAGVVGHLGHIQSQTKAVVLYGYTQNLMDDGTIPGYPPQHTRVFCMIGDAICAGTLIVTPSHLTYVEDVPQAVDFFAEQLGGDY